MISDLVTPLISSYKDPHKVISTLTREMMDKKAHLNSTMLNISTDPPQSESLISSVKDTLYKKMCAKLAVISIDIVKNLSISNHVLAQSQQSDDYLSVIRENISLPENPFPKFRIINQVLYK